MSPHVCVVAPEMGASSTTTQARGPPISKRATINGMTSDGSPAFLPVADSTEGRHGLRHEKRIKHYILGRTKNGAGYYHIKTLEAHHIMFSQVLYRIHCLDSDIAMQRACYGPNKASNLAQKTDELNRLKEVHSELYRRSKAAKPTG